MLERLRWPADAHDLTLLGIKLHSPFLGPLFQVVEVFLELQLVLGSLDGPVEDAVFIRKNLKQCPKDLKELAYLSLVKSKLEYAASVWDPHHTSDTNKLEQVQRRAARFVCNNYSPYSSVTQMLSDLGWQQLKDRRKHIRLALYYKIVHHLIAVPHEDILRKADSRTRASHNYKYRTLRSHKDPFKFSFFAPDYTGMESLSADIVHSDTIHIFKNRLHPALSQRPPATSSELVASIQLASACI